MLTRRPPVLVLLGIFLALCLSSARAQTDAVPLMVGLNGGYWDLRDGENFRSVIRLKADGVWTDGDQPKGRWAVANNQLEISYQEPSGRVERYALPPRDGVLHGQDAKGRPETLTRRPGTLREPLLGEWDFFNPGDGKRAKVTLGEDGAFAEDGRRIGCWQLVGNRIYLSFDAHHDWRDVYDLPVKDGALYGQNRHGDALTLSRSGTTPGNRPVKALPPALVGAWSFHNAADGKRATQTLAADGKFLQDGAEKGTWQTVADQLVLTYQDHRWADTYNLPADGGTIHGRNPAGHELTLARADGTGSTASVAGARANAPKAQTTITHTRTVSGPGLPPGGTTLPSGNGLVIMGQIIPAPNFDTAPAATTTTTFTGLEAMLATLPATTRLRSGADYDSAAIEQAGNTLWSKLPGKRASLRVKAQALGTADAPAGKSAMKIVAADTSVDVHGTPVAARVTTYFAPERVASLTGIKAGDTVTLSGVVGPINFDLDDGKPVFSVQLLDGKVEARK